MQTIEEYKAYTKQLEGEVKKWHDAFDGLMIERNQLVNRLTQYEKEEYIMIPRDVFGCLTSDLAELDKLRKNEVEWDMAKARIKELESEINQLKKR